MIEGEAKHLNRHSYHEQCMACCGCEKRLKQKAALWDGKLMCNACFNKTPRSVQKRIAANARIERQRLKEHAERQRSELAKIKS